MEQKTPRPRLRLNLFDGIVLVLALAVAGVLLWMGMGGPGGGGQSASVSTVEYTIRFQKWAQGSHQLIQPGDQLVDNIKNFELGTVVSATPVPAQTEVLDNENKIYVQAPIQGYEDILVTVQSPCTQDGENIMLDSGFDLRIGETAYIKGHGYMASGPVVAIEREGLE